MLLLKDFITRLMAYDVTIAHSRYNRQLYDSTVARSTIMQQYNNRSTEAAARKLYKWNSFPFPDIQVTVRGNNRDCKVQHLKNYNKITVDYNYYKPTSTTYSGKLYFCLV